MTEPNEAKATDPPAVGKVYLVGAGPGAASLITLRGVQCLQQADVIFYDYLVNPSLLKHARDEAQKISLGRHGERGRLAIWPQEKINEQLVAEASAGKRVVRLKSGDPAIFARGAEECAALSAAGIPFEMVPGVTAALAAGTYAGIPVTHRDVASAVALVTAQENPAKNQSALDYHALAQFPGTLVFYMGITTAEFWTRALIDAGKSGKTPVAIVRRCSLPDQRVVHCSLETAAATINGEPRLRPPAIIIVGDVAELGKTHAWFAGGGPPLSGKRILVTRPRRQAPDLVSRFEQLGAELLVQPAIEIRTPSDTRSLDAQIAQLDQYDWLVFSSGNGVQHFLQRLWELGRDARALSRLRLAAVGPATADQLAIYHLRADLVPKVFDAEMLAEELAGEVRGKRCLLVRGDRGREVLAQKLSPLADVQQVIAYESVDTEALDPVVQSQFESGGIHWVTVTSPAIARSLGRLIGDWKQDLRLVSISPLTSGALREQGFSVAAEARENTMDALVEAVVAAEQSSP